MNSGMTGINPGMMGMNPGMMGMNPGMMGMNPGMMGMNPGMMGMNPGMMGMNPGMMGMNPGMLGMNPGMIGMNPGMMGMNPGMVDNNPPTNNSQFINLIFKHKTSQIRVTIQADYKETLGSVLNKYIAKSGDNHLNLYINNSKKINESLTVGEAGLINYAIIDVVAIDELEGADSAITTKTFRNKNKK